MAQLKSQRAGSGCGVSQFFHDSFFPLITLATGFLGQCSKQGITFSGGQAWQAEVLQLGEREVTGGHKEEEKEQAQ